MKEIFKKVILYILTKEAILVLRKYKPQVIGITGTVGKTSTKDAVYAALSKFEYARRSQKSFNTDFGVPLTILGQNIPAKLSDVSAWLKIFLEGLMLIVFPNHYPKWLVLEVGTDRPGDIKEITEWLRPDIVIVTKLAEVPVHVEAFGSPQYLFEEKGNLVRALKPGGTLILNGDDKDVVAYKNISEERVVLFGNSRGSDVSATNYEVVYDEAKLPRGVIFEVSVEGSEPMQVAVNGTLGEQHSYHVLAALAVVKVLGENVAAAAKVFQNERPTPGRVRLIEGIKGSMLIDDTYNSSPVALDEAMKTLKSVKLSSRSARRIAMLGDMLELGRYTIDEHKKAGIKAAKTVGLLATVGIRSRYTAQAALENGLGEEKVFQFDESVEAGRFIKDLVKPGDIILIKGSQGIRMEKCVEELMAHPEDKAKLLVRQDPEWQDR
jgi:UDP-N-acetylmuramoyl-tripeptide--D-alanyl-D-alanine ligase